MGRLTRRSNDEIFLTCGFYSSYYWKQNPFYEAVDKLAHYEDLEEQLMESAEIDIDSMVGEFMHYYNLQKENRLIELPCAVGDTVWIVRENIYEATVHRVVLSISESDNFINLGVGYEYADWFYDDGRKATATELCRYLRDAFPTKEEAEAKLKELEE